MAIFNTAKCILLLILYRISLGQARVMPIPRFTHASSVSARPASTVAAAISPITTQVSATLTHLVLAEEVDSEGSYSMRKIGFSFFINAWITFVQGRINVHGADSLFPDDEYTFDDNGFRIDVFASNMNKPSLGDLHSAGVAVRRHVEHFALSRFEYRDIQVSISRMGTPKDGVLAIMDIWFTGPDMAGSGPNGTLPDRESSCLSQKAQSTFKLTGGLKRNITLASLCQEMDNCP